MSSSESFSAERLYAVTIALGADIRRCGVELNSADADGRIDQFWARALVRSFFALVEAMVYELKLVVQAADAAGELVLTLPERALLDDSTYDLDESGRPVSRPRFLTLERQFRFVYNIAARLFGVPELPVSDHRYASFRRAVRIRNRITHPKDPSDVDLSKEEVADVRAAILWFGEVQVALNVKWQALVSGRSNVPAPPGA